MIEELRSGDPLPFRALPIVLVLVLVLVLVFPPFSARRH
jgi:hypothetical protein